eukprot:g52291.t1
MATVCSEGQLTSKTYAAPPFLSGCSKSTCLDTTRTCSQRIRRSCSQIKILTKKSWRACLRPFLYRYTSYAVASPSTLWQCISVARGGKSRHVLAASYYYSAYYWLLVWARSARTSYCLR